VETTISPLQASLDGNVSTIQQSIATNPTFSFISPRYFTAYSESALPVAFFVDGRRGDQQLNMADALSFYQGMQMPADFFRPNGSFGLAEIGTAIMMPCSIHTLFSQGSARVQQWYWKQPILRALQNLRDQDRSVVVPQPYR
jgi:hypothetical protein